MSEVNGILEMIVFYLKNIVLITLPIVEVWYIVALIHSSYTAEISSKEYHIKLPIAIVLTIATLIIEIMMNFC